MNDYPKNDSGFFSKGLSVFGSLYIRRWLESRYDQLIELPVFASIRSKSAGKKHFAEAMLYALMAYADQKFPTNSALGVGAKAVFMDAAPEISSRLLNDTRKELEVFESSATNNVQERPAAVRLLELDNDTLLPLLIYLEEQEEADKTKFIDFASSASEEELIRFCGLSESERANFLRIHVAQKTVSSVGGGFKEILSDIFKVLRVWTSKGKDLGIDLVHRYVNHMLFVLKMVGVVLFGAFVTSCFVSGLSGILLSLALLLSTCLFGGTGEWARRRNIIWLVGGGFYTGAVAFFLAILALSDQKDAVLAVNVLFLVAVPVLIITAIGLPITMILEVLRGVSPGLHASLIRAFQLFLGVFLGLMLFVAGVVLFPPSGPIGFLLFIPVVAGVSIAAGFGLTRVSGERYISAPVILTLSVISLVSIFLLGMPNVRKQIQSMPSALDRSLGGALTSINPESSAEIQFVTEDGTPIVWFAPREEGGFDLFNAKGAGPYYTKDGRELILADSQETRREIINWVDLQAYRLKEALEAEEAQRIARAKAENEERRIKQLEAAALEEEKRLASYLLVESLPERMSYLIHASGPSRETLETLQMQMAEALSAAGSKAEAGIFSQEFVKSRAYDSFINGQASSDLEKMPLSQMGEQIVFLKCNLIETKTSQRFSGLFNTRVQANLHVIDTNTGRLLHRATFDVSGPGPSESISVDAAFSRLIEQITKKKF